MVGGLASSFAMELCISGRLHDVETAGTECVSEKGRGRVLKQKTDDLGGVAGTVNGQSGWAKTTSPAEAEVAIFANRPPVFMTYSKPEERAEQIAAISGRLQLV